MTSTCGHCGCRLQIPGARARCEQPIRTVCLCFRLHFEPRNRYGSMTRGSVLCILPFDRAANGRLLISRRHTGARNRAHGLDKLSGRPSAGRICAAFVEPAAVLELAVGAVTEEVRRTHCPIRPRDCLGLVVQIRKRETMSLREMLHILK